jgi:hypothetical protein
MAAPDKAPVNEHDLVLAPDPQRTPVVDVDIDARPCLHHTDSCGDRQVGGRVCATASRGSGSEPQQRCFSETDSLRRDRRTSFIS